MTPPDSAPSAPEMWTKEPWLTGQPEEGYTHGIKDGFPDIDDFAQLPLADYDRAIACVNATAGVSDPAAMLEKVRAALTLVLKWDSAESEYDAADMVQEVRTALALLPNQK